MCSSFHNTDRCFFLPTCVVGAFFLFPSPLSTSTAVRSKNFRQSVRNMFDVKFLACADGTKEFRVYVTSSIVRCVTHTHTIAGQNKCFDNFSAASTMATCVCVCVFVCSRQLTSVRLWLCRSSVLLTNQTNFLAYLFCIISQADRRARRDTQTSTPTHPH